MKPKEIKKFRDSYTKYDKDCVFEGYKLAVLFDEKDEVKSKGGRWNAEGSHWWMPAKKLLDEIHDNGTLIRDWLNDNQMIMGQYGKFNESTTDVQMGASTNIYKLVNDDTQRTYKVHFFDKKDAVMFESIPKGSDSAAIPNWMTLEEARVMWDELVSGGWYRGEDAT